MGTSWQHIFYYFKFTNNNESFKIGVHVPCGSYSGTTMNANELTTVKFSGLIPFPLSIPEWFLWVCPNMNIVEVINTGFQRDFSNTYINTLFQMILVLDIWNCMQMNCTACKWPQIFYFWSQLAHSRISQVTASGTQIFLCPCDSQGTLFILTITYIELLFSCY